MIETKQNIAFPEILNEIFLDHLNQYHDQGYIILMGKRIIFTNNYFLKISGYSKEYINNLLFTEIVTGYAKEVALSILENCEGCYQLNVLPLILSNGNIKLFNVYCKKYPDSNDHIFLLNMKQAESVLDIANIKNDELYESILNTISENILLIDRDCNIIEFIKSKIEENNGISAIGDYFSSTAIKQIKIYINKRWENGNARYFEFQSHKKFYESRLIFYKDNLFVFSFNDISLRKKVENKLAESQYKLQKLNNEKDLLLSIIAHDLKNPFNIINGFCSILLKTGRSFSEEKKEQIINHIASSSMHGFNLLENLLEWSRSQSGRILYNPVRINLNEIALHVIRYYSANIGNKNLNISVDIPSSLFVYADNHMLSTILRNLISNAIKFSPENGQINVSVRIDNHNYMEVCIKDNGVGLSEKQLSNLFKVGKTVSTNGTVGEKGTGLGLLLCKEFVERNKGEIFVKSEKNKGSEFIFTLPVFEEN